MPKTHERRVAPKILKTQTLHYVEEIAGTASAGVTEIPLEQIDLDNTQFEYRLDPDLAALVESIKKDGQQLPVILRGRKPPYQLICGFRRARSIKAIGGATVKAIILPDIDDEKAHRLSVLENEERKSLTDLDRANACQRLQKEGKTQEEIARIMGCSQPQVSRYLRLLTLPEPVFASLKKGKITTAQALALKVTDELYSAEYLLEFLHRLEKENLSSRTLERMMKAKKKTKSGTKADRVYFKRTKQGFKLIGFTYRPDMPPEEKKKAVSALKEALALLETELKKGEKRCK
jgi:ParB/RepB/Spo0J family partition protein